MRLRDGLVRDLAVHHIEAADECGLLLAGFGQTQVGQEFDVTISDVRQRLGRRARRNCDRYGMLATQ